MVEASFLFVSEFVSNTFSIMQENSFIKEVIDMKEWTTKDFRKAAFAVGFGLTLGKYFGGIIDNIAGAIIKTTLKKSAEKGNEYAQNACRDMKIKYEKTESEGDDSKIQMGFHG